MHVHLRDPGLEYKEDIVSGTRAAAAGGFTTVACMPNTSPVIDSAALVSFIVEKARQVGVVSVLPIGAVTKGLAGKELAEIADMSQAGAVGITDDGMPVTNSELMRTALQYSAMYGLPVITHSEDRHLAEDGQMHFGTWSNVLGLRGIPAAAEAAMIARDCMLAELTGGRLHVAHVSTELSLSVIAWARSRGIPVTCEVSPHHLTLTDEEVARTSYSTSTKVNPPLRSASDVAAMLAGLRDGVIDAIASDHAPHSVDDKDVEYNFAPNGIIGLETTVPVLLTGVVAKGHADLMTVIRAMTLGPARILGLASKGRLAAGMDADLVLLDLDRPWSIDPAKFLSKSRNTPFAGWEVRGLAAATIVAGRVVQRDGKICV
jgi:dihydroorotase